MKSITIISADDPLVAPYTSIRERDLIRRHGRFLLEGAVTLEVALRRGRFPLDSVFLSPAKADRLAPLLDRYAPDLPVYVADLDLMSAVAGFPIHRGVLACARVDGDLTPAQVLEAATGPTVLCVGLSNHDNVGAVFRNAAALGARGVLLDAESCDPLYRKAIRVSAGTVLWLPFARTGSADALLAAVRTARQPLWALTPSAEADSIWDMPTDPSPALLIGPEGPGLPGALIAQAQPVRLPMAEGVDSLNVATAAAIALAALRRHDGAKR